MKVVSRWLVRGLVDVPSCLEADADGWYPSRLDWFDAGEEAWRGWCRLVRMVGIGGSDGCCM